MKNLGADAPKRKADDGGNEGPNAKLAKVLETDGKTKETPAIKTKSIDETEDHAKDETATPSQPEDLSKVTETTEENTKAVPTPARNNTDESLAGHLASLSLMEDSQPDTFLDPDQDHDWIWQHEEASNALARRAEYENWEREWHSTGWKNYWNSVWDSWHDWQKQVEDAEWDNKTWSRCNSAESGWYDQQALYRARTVEQIGARTYDEEQPAAKRPKNTEGPEGNQSAEAPKSAPPTHADDSNADAQPPQSKAHVATEDLGNREEAKTAVIKTEPIESQDASGNDNEGSKVQKPQKENVQPQGNGIGINMQKKEDAKKSNNSED